MEFIETRIVLRKVGTGYYARVVDGEITWSLPGAGLLSFAEDEEEAATAAMSACPGGHECVVLNRAQFRVTIG